ncbi:MULTISPECIES: LytTR family DNA-binding domain-containing protein [Paenibacillus]|uniref:LytTR family DNA-binding domain-containing protein n=1 Tax=Paenibacillus TaxID=44249 RepID=UPI00038F6C43|nr:MULTISPECIES: LytTR family DNA-binding domain-containing protein [Paenibacillus]CDN45991.1 hypothetical protein BN871_JW_00040 [Paenibacillus sp. P22]
MNQISVVERTGKEFRIIALPLADVQFVSVSRGIIQYHTQDKQYAQITTLEELEAFLSHAPSFVRSERGFIINTDHAECFDDERQLVVMLGGAEVPVSNRRRRVVLARVKVVRDGFGRISHGPVKRRSVIV